MSDVGDAHAASLCFTNVHAWYGESHILHGINFEVHAGEVVTLIGRNGAGKTTALKSIMGIVPRRSGSIVYNSIETIGMSADQIARSGIAYCPEERGIFHTLNVQENLLLPPVIQPGGITLQEIDAIFPNLKERRASSGGKLSGGEQQMLAIARILRTGARMLLLDEPTEGLAPVIVNQIASMIKAIKTKGYTVLLVEQNYKFASALADRHYVMENGRIVDHMTAGEVASNVGRMKSYLGV